MPCFRSLHHSRGHYPRAHFPQEFLKFPQRSFSRADLASRRVRPFAPRRVQTIDRENLAEVKSGDAAGFALASWVRTHLPNTQVVLAGTIATATEKAGDICQEGPALSKPYDHRLVLDHIQRLLAARDRNDRT
jgi:hypothetical protein